MFRNLNNADEMIIDSFAGGGGASTGIELALGKPVDIAINHDLRAIQMHKQNHPWTKHYCENIFAVDPKEATQGRKVGLFWLSPDCTHFSKAKGGKPVKKEIRGLAWLAAKWASAVKPRVIMLENVEEFKTWGPIDSNGKPIKSKKGKTFKQFVFSLQNQGYEVEWKTLRACDYGVPTIRKRLFLIARCDGQPIIWPKPTHGKADGLLPYRTAAEIIDWSIPGKSIFGRKKPLSENTMKRIARGLEKYVFNNPEPFVFQIGQTGFGGNGRVQSINDPLRTITRKNEHCVVTPVIVNNNFKNSGRSVEDPLATITSQSNRNALVTPTLIQVGYGEAKGQKPRALDLNKPLGTIPSGGNKFAVCSFISKRFGQFGKTIQATDLNKPLPTVTATDHNQLVSASFIERQFTNSVGHKVDSPLGTITSNDKSRLVQAFLIKYFGGPENNQSINEPLHTITSKDRFGLVTLKGVDYQIVDIQMRMLEPKELYAAQGFPLDYKFEFSVNGKKYPKYEQIARCGNSVCPQVVTALVKSNLSELAVNKTIETMKELENTLNCEVAG